MAEEGLLLVVVVHLHIASHRIASHRIRDVKCKREEGPARRGEQWKDGVNGSAQDR